MTDERPVCGCHGEPMRRNGKAANGTQRWRCRIECCDAEARYRSTDKRRVTNHAYDVSEKGRKRHSRYKRSEKGRARDVRYEATPGRMLNKQLDRLSRFHY